MRPGTAAKRYLTYGLAALMGTAAYFLTFDLSFFFGTGAYWEHASGDVTVHLAGLRYFQAEPWQFPLFDVQALGYPPGTNIIFTDSIPLLGGLAKVFVGLTGLGINYLGGWLFLCWVLQPLAAVYAVRGAGVRQVFPQLAAAFLSLLVPAWLARLGHAALCGHFLLLFAIGLYLRGRFWRPRQFTGIWMALLCVALLIHPYIMMMCAGMFAATCLARFDFTTRGALQQILSFGAVMVALLMVMVISGHLSGLGGSNGFGYYSMNLLSPAWPQKSGLFPGFQEIIDATGGQYEGFNYLGAGFLLLLGAALVTGRTQLVGIGRRHWPLFLALAGFLLLALSNRIYLGDVRLVSINPVPSFMEQFRSSGRFFWPVTYVLLISSVALLMRANPRTGLFVLTAALPLQVLDSAPLRQGLGNAARHGGDPGLQMEVWNPFIASHDRVHVFPSYYCSSGDAPRKIMGLILAASHSVTPISTVYTARTRDENCDQEIYSLDRLKLEPGVLIILLNPVLVELSGEIPSDSCRTLNDIIACTDQWERLPIELSSVFGKVLPVRLSLQAGQGVSFEGPGKREFLLSGWSGPESWGVWSDGELATLVVDLSREPGDQVLCFRLTPFIDPEINGQRVDVLVDGKKQAQWTFDEPLRSARSVTVPARAGAKHLTYLTFFIRSPKSPARLGHSNDDRRLGIGLIDLRLLSDQDRCSPV